MAASSSGPGKASSDAIRLAGGASECVGHESWHEALIEAIRAAGGSKVVAAALWPSAAARDLEGARRRLASCLEPDRAEKLALDEVLHILRLGRLAGCHAGIGYLCDHLGYAAPVPIEPRDEADQLRRELLAMGRELQAKLARLEQVGSAPGLRAAA